MITENEATRLLKRADPARVDDSAPFIDAAGYLAELRTRSMTVTLIDTEATPTRPTRRRRRLAIWAAAAAAVVVIIAGVLVLATRDEATDRQIPAGPSTTLGPDPSTPGAEEVAREFLDAYVAFDADRAMTYLSAGAVVIDSAISAAVDSPETMRPALDLFEASGYQQMILDCEQQDETAAGISVRCPFEFHSIRSDEIGFGPYGDNYWDLIVRDGEIVSAENTIAFLTNGFSQEMWAPFSGWVSAAHPDDAVVMYTDGSHTDARTSDESIRLWEERTREYVQVVRATRESYPGDVGAICATQAARLGELVPPAESALDQVAAWSVDAAAIMEQAHGELIALDRPPATDTMAYTSFYARLVRLVRILEQSAEAANAGDAARLAELDAEYLDVRQAMTSGPAGSGLEECLASLPR